MHGSAIDLILNAGLVVKGVMGLLLFFSVYSWAIIFYKFRQLLAAERENESFFRAFDQGKSLDKLFETSKRLVQSPVANVFRSVHRDYRPEDREELRRALKRFEALETARLEKHLTFLATTGSTTPFIGLFGTVWGIMDSFRGIGATGSASLAIVAPGIAEALIATAMGLVAAIPAVIAYNYYLSRVRRIVIETEDFSEEILHMLVKSECNK